MNKMDNSFLVYSTITGRIRPSSDGSAVNDKCRQKKSSPTGDGIVPYGSAHIEGAQSELIIKWGHNVPSSPACAAEVRRILLLSLE